MARNESLKIEIPKSESLWILKLRIRESGFANPNVKDSYRGFVSEKKNSQITRFVSFWKDLYMNPASLEISHCLGGSIFVGHELLYSWKNNFLIVNMVNVIIWLFDQLVEDSLAVIKATSQKDSLVNVIIWILWSDMVWPKVITFCGAYCNSSIVKVWNGFLGLRLSIFYKLLSFGTSK